MNEKKWNVKTDWNISSIEELTEDMAREMAIETMPIKEHNIYFVDFDGTFGYSCLVFKNNHHIRYANDYQLHHRRMTRDELREYYIKSLNHKLYTETEIAEPIKSYDEFKAKEYFLHNYYGMRVDHVSMFHIFHGKAEEKAFEEKVKNMVRNPVAHAYMDKTDKGFVKHHIDLFMQLQDAKNKMSDDYDYWKSAFLSEMYNHEYGINWQADYDTLSAFGNVGWHEDKLNIYFEELHFTDTQRNAYVDARHQYYKNNANL